ncbi:hypothetical protein I3760_05G021100 [Carya illinoinensis]|nr:hypothetical protein I3760_05G021100 [Carya illinoinensis]KAG2704781.1 hypothetical protein I3760_05G021100 [Carya illinoinensis]KAG2704782.1 hypothetical protein I3760_05G021100 [Carya illinoinensis]
MANNPRFSGVQPPIVGSVEPPRSFVAPMSSQFRQVVPAQQSQQFNPVPSQHFYPVGLGAPLMNVGLPHHHTLQPQFSQSIQQFPPRPGQLGHATLPSQAIPLPIAQPNMHSTSEKPIPQINSQTPNSYSPVLSGPERPLTSSYTFAPSSYGQPHTNFNASTQYQFTPQMHAPDVSSGRQLGLSSESQGTGTVSQFAKQPLVPTTVTSATIIQPNATRESPTDWIEHTSADGRRYYHNKKTRQSSWEKPLELMTPIEKADASTNWKEYTSPDGRKYYYNKVTKESKWSIPEELKLAREQVEKASFMGTQPDTFEIPPVSTTVPPSVVKAPSGAETSSSPAQGVASSPASEGHDVAAGDLKSPLLSETPASTVVASTTDENANGMQTLLNVAALSDAVPENSEAAVTIASTIHASMENANNLSAGDVPNSSDGAPVKVVEGVDVIEALEEVKKDEIGEKLNDIGLEAKSVDPEPMIYANKLEAKHAFKALLESANVGSDWTWDRAMRVIINDRRYGALKTLGERKQVFNEFLSQRKKQEAEERRIKLKKAREEFKQMLEESSELTSSTRWSKAVSMFENDERFKAVERDRERRDLFDNYLGELKEKERARAEDERKRNVMEYRQFLESCDFIKADSQWRKLQDRLEADERCSRLEKIDRLDIFLEYIRDLEKEDEERRKIQKEELRKVERKNRDEFRKLMEEHVTAGTLTAKTHWRDYCMKVKDLPAYTEIASNTSGSTPKELFQDVLEELEKQYHEDKTRIKDAVKLGKILLSSTWVFEDFKTAISKDFSPPISDVNLKLIFDELLERVREKEEKEAKKRKRLADDFFHLLSSIKEITASSKWEDCKQLFADSREFSSIGEESLCREVFEQYISQLKEQAKEHERKRKEEKAKKEKEREEKEKRKVKQRREKEEGREREKDEEDNIKKQRKRHQSSEDIVDENEKDRSRKSHGSTSDHKKSRRHASAPESDDESRHKRHKRDHRNGSRRYGDHEELEDGEFGEDRQSW